MDFISDGREEPREPKLAEGPDGATGRGIVDRREAAAEVTGLEVGELRKAVRRIASGDLSQRVAVKAEREFMELGDDFNRSNCSLSSFRTMR